MISTDSEKVMIGKLLGLIEGILRTVDEEFNKGVNVYPDLVKAKNILLSGDVIAMRTIRKKLRSGFRMVDESIRVSDELNRMINEAYEIVVMNKIFDTR